MNTALAQTLIAFSVASAGALTAVTAGVSHKQLCALISFAAGSLLSVTFFHLLPGAWGVVPLPALGLAVVSGFILFYVISRYVFHMCPACAASHFEEQEASKLKSMYLLLAFALTIHNIMDGLAIALDQHQALHSSVFLTISFHKFPEGLALCALLMRSGQNKTKAFLMALAFEASSFLGWLLGASLLKGSAESVWLHMILMHIGGGFIYLSLHATLNEMETHSPRFIFLFFLCGFILVGLLR